MAGETQELGFYDSEPLDLRYYLRLLWTVVSKYWRWLVILPIIAGTVTWFQFQSVVPTYSASTTLHLAPDFSTDSSYGGYYWSGSITSFQNTQMGILKSKQLLTRVVRDLGLHKPTGRASDKPTPEISFWASMQRAIGFGGGADAAKPKPEPEPVNQSLSATAERNRVEAMAGRLAGAISVRQSSQSDMSNLIDIRVTWTQPEMAAHIANSVAEQYIDLLYEKNVEASIDSQEFLSERLVQLRSELREAEERLQAFREDADIISDSGRATDQVDSELAAVSSKLIEARENRLRLADIVERIEEVSGNREELLNVPALANNSRISSMKDALYDIQRRRSELSKRYGPLHNRMIALRSEQQATEAAFGERIEDVVNGIRADYEFAIKNERSLERELAQVRDRKQDRGRSGFRLKDLQQDVDTKREIYSSFLERLNQTDATGPVKNKNIWVVDRAAPRGGANLPPVDRYIMMSTVLTFLATLGLGVLFEMNRNTLTSEDEVESNLGFPCLGLVPLLAATEDAEPVDENSSHARFLAAYRNSTDTRFSESVRSVRTSLKLHAMKSGVRRMLVTSAEAGEGKSSIVLSLAESFAQMERVLIVDCDLRQPSLERAVNTTSHKLLGVADVIAGAAEARDCIFEIPDSNVHLLAAGSRTLNPLELLSSPQFTRLLNSLSDEYDLIILDTPPCLAVSDAYVLAEQADTVVFVVKAESTRIGPVRSVLAKLKSVRVDVAGVLLNQVNFDAPHFSYGSRYGYYGRYGDYGEGGDAGDEQVVAVDVRSDKARG